MRAEDKSVFAEAARRFQSWILVRCTNEDSLQFIGKAGFQPKPMSCKAKTADYEPDPRRKTVAGLVANPAKVPRSFSVGRLSEATRIWDDFARHHLYPGSHYRVESDSASPYFGCLKLDGDFIYGDYDLFDIVPVGHERRNLALVKSVGDNQIDKRGARLTPVQDYVNRRLGTDMIKHGAQAQYMQGFEKAHVFDPKGNYEMWDAEKVQSQYREWKRPLHER